MNGRRMASLATGVALTALAVVTGCQIEVNINTDGDDPSPNPITAAAPDAPPEVSPPDVPPPPPPIVRPQARPTGDESPVRDALLRYSEPERERHPETPDIDELAEEPTFTPFTERPEILNRMEVIESMQTSYPPLLREAGIGGTVRVYFLIDREGDVVQTRLDQSSGHGPLDEAALRVASVYRFSPARNRAEPVPVWVSFPITFQVR